MDEHPENPGTPAADEPRGDDRPVAAAGAALDPAGPTGADGRITGLAALELPLRRDLYRTVREAGDWVSRDEAAETLDLNRSTAAFHLDKLVDAGVLEITYERLTGRTGPGAGRPAKLYRPVDEEVAASFPDRRYDLAGSVLAAAVAESTRTGVAIGDTLAAAARAAGVAIGAGAGRGRTDDAEGSRRSDTSGGPDDAAHRTGRDALVAILGDHGYEPEVLEGGDVVLDNCPFHRLADQERELVCGMNLDLLTGVLDEIDPDDTMEARLQPEEGRCCVRVSRR